MTDEGQRGEQPSRDEGGPDVPTQPPRPDPGPILSPRPPSEPILKDRPSTEPILQERVRTEPIFKDRSEEGAVREDVDRRPPEKLPADTEAAATPLGQELVRIFRSRDLAAMASGLERAGRLLLTIAIFAVPVVIDPRTIDSFNLAKLTALWVFGVLAVSAWWLSTTIGRQRRALPRSRIVRLSFLLLAITFVATVFSPNRTLSVFGLYHRYEGLVSVGLYVGLLTALVVLFWRRPDALRAVVVALGAATLLAGLHVLAQRAGFDPVEWRAATGAAPTFPIGPLGNSAFTAGFLGIALPFVLYLVLSSRSLLRRIIWSLVGVLALVSLWVTQGRAGIIAAGVGVLSLGIFISRLQAWMKAAFVVLALVGLLVFSLVVAGVTDPGPLTQESVLRTQTQRYRGQMWDSAWHVFLDRPVLGWGPESFYGQFPRFRTAAEAREQGLSITDKPHNIYLGWATSTGIAGLLTYLILVGSAIVMVATRVSKLARPRRLMAAAFGAGLVAYLVQGLYSVDVPPLALMGWVTLGGIVVLLERHRDTGDAEEAEEAEGRGPAADPTGSARSGWSKWADAPWLRASWVVPSAVGLVALVAITLGLGPLRADHAAWAAQRRASQGWSTATMDLYDKAIGLNPRESAYRGLAGSYLELVAGDPRTPFSSEVALRRAVSFYDQALDLQPRNIYFMINLARVYSRLGNNFDGSYFQSGDRVLARAVSLDPLDPQIYDLHADLLRQWAAKLKLKSTRDEVARRAQNQAAIAQALRQGLVIR